MHFMTHFTGVFFFVSLLKEYLHIDQLTEQVMVFFLNSYLFILTKRSLEIVVLANSGRSL